MKQRRPGIVGKGDLVPTIHRQYGKNIQTGGKNQKLSLDEDEQPILKNFS